MTRNHHPSRVKAEADSRRLLPRRGCRIPEARSSGAASGGGRNSHSHCRRFSLPQGRPPPPHRPRRTSCRPSKRRRRTRGRPGLDHGRASRLRKVETETHPRATLHIDYVFSPGRCRCRKGGRCQQPHARQFYAQLAWGGGAACGSGGDGRCEPGDGGLHWWVALGLDAAARWKRWYQGRRGTSEKVKAPGGTEER